MRSAGPRNTNLVRRRVRRFFETRDSENITNYYQKNPATALIGEIANAFHVDLRHFFVKEHKEIKKLEETCYLSWYSQVIQVDSFIDNLNCETSEISRRVGYSISSIRAIVPGRGQMPKSSGFIQGLVEAFNLNPNYIFYKNQPMYLEKSISCSKKDLPIEIEENVDWRVEGDILFITVKKPEIKVILSYNPTSK